MRLELRVIPNASQTRFTGTRNGELVLRVSAPARDGRANRVARAYLAETLGVRPSAVQLIGGEKSRHKKFEIVGLESPRGRKILEDSMRLP